MGPDSNRPNPNIAIEILPLPGPPSSNPVPLTQDPDKARKLLCNAKRLRKWLKDNPIPYTKIPAGEPLLPIARWLFPNAGFGDPGITSNQIAPYLIRISDIDPSTLDNQWPEYKPGWDVPMTPFKMPTNF